MKTSCQIGTRMILLIGLLIQLSCAVSNRINQTVDSSGKTSGLSLRCTLIEIGSRRKVPGYFLFSTSSAKMSEITLAIPDKQNSYLSGLNTKLLLDLDSEKVEIGPFDEKKGFRISDNLWIPIIHTKNIAFTTICNGKTVDYRCKKNSESMKKFFQQAVLKSKLDTPFLPEGKKKW